MNVLLADSATNKTIIIVLIAVLVAFIALILTLGIVFVKTMRKRAPVVKVIVPPPAIEEEEEREEPANGQESAEETKQEDEVSVAAEPVGEVDFEQVEFTEEVVETEGEPTAKVQETAPSAEPAAAVAEEESEEDEGDVEYVKEGDVRVRYEKSFTAKLIQLKDDAKDWYSALKNALLSYQKVRARMSWKRESFRLGRMTVARFAIRGKTLCLMLAVEPAGYVGTKYAIEDVSKVASTADTPCLYRIKNARRAKYAAEMIEGFMRELQVEKNGKYTEQDFALPYEDTATLLEQGLVKRVETTAPSPFASLAAEQSKKE